MTKPLLLALCLAACSFAACKTTDTNFSQSYRNPGYEETVFKKIMVIAIASDQESRQAFEDALSSAIGGAAQPSIEVFPNEGQISEDELHAAINAGGFDAVLLLSLIHI